MFDAARFFVVFTFLAVFLSLGCVGKQGIQVKDGSDIAVHRMWGPSTPVGAPVNSSKWEDGPSISPDGSMLYFTIGEGVDVDAYYSRQVDGVWSTPTPLRFNLPDFPDGAVHTQDNKALYFASVRPGGMGLGDIYYCSNFDKDCVNLGSPVNTEHMESEPHISPDGDTLFFAAVRPDGLGDADIWYSKRANGGWTVPVNIGSPVNTDLQETQPFLASDGQELYFMSVNRDGIPGPAIFKSTKTGDIWSKPELVVSGMVGEPTLTAKKDKLYFVKIFHKNGKLQDADIYYAEKNTE